MMKTRSMLQFTLAMAVLTMVPAVLHASTDGDGERIALTREAPRKVAVIDFSSADGKSFTSCQVTMTPLSDAGKKLSREIADRLKGWAEYEIVTADRVAKAIRRHRVSVDDLHEASTLKELAEALSVDAVVVGRTDGSRWSGKGHRGASLYASIEMRSTSGGEVLWSVDGYVQNTRDDRGIVPELAEDMMENLYAKLHGMDDSSRPLLALKEKE